MAALTNLAGGGGGWWNHACVFHGLFFCEVQIIFVKV